MRYPIKMIDKRKKFLIFVRINFRILCLEQKLAQ